MEEDSQRYALITLLPLLVYDVEETQPITVRPMTPDGRFGPLASHDDGGRDNRLVQAVYVDWAIRSRYQVDEVERLLRELFVNDRRMALAVWYEYVNQWSEYESGRRRELADEGIDWMLARTEEILLPYLPDGPQSRTERDRQIKRLKKLGWPVRRIALQYNLTTRRVRTILGHKLDVGSDDDGSQSLLKEKLGGAQ